MEIGINPGYWAAGRDAEHLRLIADAERLGFGAVWVPETHGPDAPTVLSWLAAHTERIDIGSAVLQVPARTPATTGMTAASLDALSGGRFRLGLGMSGPRISECWHGRPFERPLAWMREYIHVVREVLARQRVRHDGEHCPVPLRGSEQTPMALLARAPRTHLPIHTGAVAPKSLELAGEIADGWLALFYSPEYAEVQLDRIRAGRERVGKSLDGFHITATVPISVGADWRACADSVRFYTALYIGGMGSQERNFYKDLAGRMGFGRVADLVQERFLEGDYKAAMAALPLDFLDATALLGPTERIAERMAEFAESGVTSLTLAPLDRTAQQRGTALRAAAEARHAVGLAG